MKKLFLFILFFTSLSFAQLIKPINSISVVGSYNNNNSLYSKSTMFSGNRDTCFYYNIGLGKSNLQNAKGSTLGTIGGNVAIGFTNLNRDSLSPTYNNIIGYSNLYYSEGASRNNISGSYNLFHGTTNIHQNIITGNFNIYNTTSLNIYDNVVLGDSNFYNSIQNLSYNEIIGYNNAGYIGNPYIAPSYKIEILGSNNMPGIRTANNIQIIGDNNLFNNGNNSQYFGGIQILGNNCLNLYAQGGGSMIAIGGGSGSKVVNGQNDLYIQSSGLGSSDTNMMFIGGFATPFIYGSYTQRYLNIKVKQLGVDSLGGTLAYHTIIGRTDRTAGIDSLTSGIDTVRTTAYDANSLVFITDLSAAGTPGHQYIDKANSVSGSYFIVLSKSAIDNSLFNWFILKTY